jgi:hypothetical protein
MWSFLHNKCYASSILWSIQTNAGIGVFIVGSEIKGAIQIGIDTIRQEKVSGK